MITTFTATKEEANRLRVVLKSYADKIGGGDYDQLYNFLRAAAARLPKRETVARHKYNRASKAE